MAISNKKERYTMIGISQTFYSTFLPDGSIDTQDRKSLLRIYRISLSIASGILKACFSIKLPSVAFTVKQPSVSFTAKNGSCV